MKTISFYFLGAAILLFFYLKSWNGKGPDGLAVAFICLPLMIVSGIIGLTLLVASFIFTP